ncbi:histidine biosynthesis family protein [Candidatus Endolissoclinum faulkneri L2]|uniref:Imidazole glycerol phosphate synthase subunit HisF n=1 Tax=Candidatus Endolissoclinum faulkneri L2 TaxID=1193729 RepID=K7YLM6_9PROT|nr:imidazole glycerol phosphate synthase subunit HisF [Candidatus Endolissoclinum faulkneri]AFX98392.1 histidine biosynthesis family protein [Candidatus Endolissoclinum faulkneri L2]
MLKVRVIPCLDVKGDRLVKGVNFVDLVDTGNPVAQAKFYNDEGADELCFLDIAASQKDQYIIFDVISRVAEQCFMPLMVGGGVRNIEDIRKLLLIGADKVVINTAAVNNPEFVRQAANKFGSQCITVAVDVKQTSGGKFNVFTHAGRQATDLDPVVWAQQMVEYGAGEIMLTSIDHDGTKQGFNISLTRTVSDSVQVPVIASGGVGTLDHLVEGVHAGHASAVLSASIFHSGTYRISEVKKAMFAAGIAVRQSN